MKILLRYIILAFVAIMLTGCWDYTEVTDRAIILGLAADYDEENKEYYLTVELSSAVSKEQPTIESVIIKGKGKSFFNAFTSIGIHTGKKPLWGHAKIVVIGNNVAKVKERLELLLDFLNRNLDFRDNILTALTKESTAEDMLKGINSKIFQLNSFHIEGTLQNDEIIGQYKSVKLYDFLQKFSNKYVSPMLPVMLLEKGEENTICGIYGMGVFKDDRLTGYLDKNEITTYLIITNNMKKGVIYTDDNNMPTEDITIIENHTDTNCEFINGMLTITINVRTTIGINEIRSNEDYNEQELEKLKEKAKEKISARIKDLINKVKKEYDSDIFEYSSVIENTFPEYWNKIKENWNQEFKNLNIEVKSEVIIKSGSMKFKQMEEAE